MTVSLPLESRTSTVPMGIGIDFDNTIVGYDNVFLEVAKRLHLVEAAFHGRKQAVRGAIRLLPNGERRWQELQGYVYGAGIRAATLFAGVEPFLRRCKAQSHTVFIISHKTEYGHFDPRGVNLRKAALDWMESKQFFDTDGLGLVRENVFFETSREGKLERIAALGCTHFIDDLEEVLAHPDFPPRVKRFLFSDVAAKATIEDCVLCPTWEHVEKAVFGD